MDIFTSHPANREAMSKRIREIFDKAVANEKVRLTGLSPSTLRTLPEHQRIVRRIDDLEIGISVWHHPHKSGGDLIVAQAFRPLSRWLGRIRGVHVVGLLVTPHGLITEPEESDLWDYT